MKLMTLCRRWWILNKRLFKKPSFVMILLLIPLLVVAMQIVSAREDSGLLTVALAAQDGEDERAREIIARLTDSGQLVRFVTCDSPAHAGTLVEEGRADAAWIFADDLAENMDKFTQHIHPRNAFVVMIQREETALMRLSHEKLNAALYPYLSRDLYQNYTYRHIVPPDTLTPAQLEAYYAAVGAEGEDLFSLVHAAVEV